MIDNINYTNVYGEASISGYDIYRNNEMIAENASVHGLFTDMTVTEQNADYAYNIVPILNNKHGLLSNTASINPSAIENILLENMIYGAKREIIINGFANQRVNIFSVDGKLITSVLNDNDNIRISIQPGIYIVNADKHSVKVFVRWQSDKNWHW